jgi:hypothetical protein
MSGADVNTCFRLYSLCELCFVVTFIVYENRLVGWCVCKYCFV